MSNNMIKKAGGFEILNHWVLAISFFILAISGFGFLFHLEQVGSAFGGFNQMRDIHNWSGVVFAVSLFLTMFKYLTVALNFSADDMAWLGKAGGYFSKKAQMPPQDELNAGQKLLYIVVLLLGIAISVTGVIMWLRPEMADVNKWVLFSFLVHNIASDIFVIAIPIHIYLATLANPGTLRIMISGTVPVEWARKRHAKWVQKLGY
ncbi:MAG: formate dehydrogenase subunit gamma [Nitrospiraceae bacterium]|nr:MAG: formate dehydrogenase subunit gamma [Nitrospiraceae bacterium]